ncbi:hypothetical protein [Nocardia amamiensis]|uniref:hypothetical protein n=1 Tax=Nocardia TaxID=1817 RepID=UPI0033DEC547
MNRKYQPPPSLFSHLEEPAVTSSPADEEVAACRPVFSSAVSCAAADDAAATADGDQ